MDGDGLKLHAVFDEVLLKIGISVPKESQIVSLVISDGERIEHFLYICHNPYPFFPKAYQKHLTSCW